MVTEIVAKYEANWDWPVLISGDAGWERGAGDHYGDIECPFCDKVICNEGDTIKIGDKCWNCPASVIRFKDRR